MLWLAQLGSNVGSWMQTVAAQWLLIGHNAALVSLIQTASLLPVFFLSLPAGVFADRLNRRRLLWTTTAAMAICTGVLAALTAIGYQSPALILLVTFLLGCGTAWTGPAWQAIQPDLVPRAQIPDAAALGSITVNAARAIGPALAGFLVAWIGPAPVFALNAVSFLFIVIALLVWRPAARLTDSEPERVGEALTAGLRYLRSAPGVRRIILRSVLFATPASALWALLPVAAHQRYHLGASGYGLLLGALGIGAMIGVVVLGRIRAIWSSSLILTVSALVFGVATACLATLPLAITTPVLVLAGIAWIATLSSLNAAMQLSLPAWVRARGLAAYLFAFMGAQAIGSFVWGLVASRTSLTAGLLASAIILLLVGATVPLLPIHERTLRLDRTIGPALPSPALTLDPTPTDGPVRVNITYTVPDEQTGAFITAMTNVERSRRRTGARSWRLYRDGSDARLFRETFTVASWGEHLRQHGERLTGSDQAVLDAARALAEPDPQVEHLFPARTPAAG
jgi:MFS family permease